MEILSWYSDETFVPKVACLGFFDGIHTGHIKLFEETLKIKAQFNLSTLFFTLSQNVEDFKKNTYSQIISNQSKQVIVQNYHFDYYLAGIVDEEFIKIGWEQFCTILQKRYCVQKVVVGEDFRFGYQREGDVAKIKAFFGSQNVSVIARDLSIPSSTQIRALLKEKALREANQYLYEPYSYEGIVQTGNKIGRTIDFPTANLYLAEKLLIPYGVYITTTRVKDQLYQSMSCYFDKNGRDALETYLIDVNLNLYDQEIKVSFIEFLRDNVKFTTLEDIKKYLTEDLSSTLAFFANNR